MGNQLEVYGRLFAAGEADNYGNTGPASFSYSDPSTMNIFALTPDVTLTSESGHDYGLGGVPEPATWALLCGGFLAVGGALRRRRLAPV